MGCAELKYIFFSHLKLSAVKNVLLPLALLYKFTGQES